MKNLSDYTGEEAIDLWCDLLEPISRVISDVEVARVIRAHKSYMDIAKVILKKHKKDVEEVLLRIDDTPVTGLNIVTRLVSLLSDIGKNEEVETFFRYAEQTKTEESSGSAMENTEAGEN